MQLAIESKERNMKLNFYTLGLRLPVNKPVALGDVVLGLAKASVVLDRVDVTHFVMPTVDAEVLNGVRDVVESTVGGRLVVPGVLSAHVKLVVVGVVLPVDAVVPTVVSELVGVGAVESVVGRLRVVTNGVVPADLVEKLSVDVKHVVPNVVDEVDVVSVYVALSNVSNTDKRVGTVPTSLEALLSFVPSLVS